MSSTHLEPAYPSLRESIGGGQLQLQRTEQSPYRDSETGNMILVPDGYDADEYCF